MFNRAPKLEFSLQSWVNISRARKSVLATGKENRDRAVSLQWHWKLLWWGL